MAQQFPDVRFPGWEVIRKLGEGSFGGVYEIHRTLPDGRVEKAALKKLTVPKDNSEIRELYSQSFSKENITAHYKDQMRELVNEYTLTQELNGCRNVVFCHDVQCVQHTDGIGWDIYIRMPVFRVSFRMPAFVQYPPQAAARFHAGNRFGSGNGQPNALRFRYALRASVPFRNLPV